MNGFVGRRRELVILARALAEISQGVAAGAGRGHCLIVRGRRRIGKSALVEEFLRLSGVPYVFYTAEIGAGADPITEFAHAVLQSELRQADVFADAVPGNWTAALRQLAGILPDTEPSVVVIDEVPYLMDEPGAFESVLQRAWDRELSRKPVLLILIGSDLSIMNRLTSYGRPLHQRGADMPVGPLNPADVAEMTGLDPADAIDAALVTGGLPIICSRWRRGADIWSFLEHEVANPVSALVVSAQLSLAAEFPEHASARSVIEAIGSGERTFTNIARAAGGMSHSTLSRSADLLIGKGVIAADLPLALHPSKDRRYRIADPYLRFWLTFIGPYLAEVNRMRSDLTVARIRRGWMSWRGRAVEPIVRESLALALPARGIAAAPAIGSYWTRTNDVEIDIVGADRAPIARQLVFLGSVKWHEGAAFDDHDLAVLARHRARLTDAPVPLLAVSRSGSSARHLDAVFGPEDIVHAWVSPQAPGLSA